MAVKKLLLREPILESDFLPDHAIARCRDVPRCLAGKKRVVISCLIGRKSCLVLIANSKQSPQLVPPAMLKYPAERNEDMHLDRSVPRRNDVHPVTARLGDSVQLLK